MVSNLDRRAYVRLLVTGNRQVQCIQDVHVIVIGSSFLCGAHDAVKLVFRGLQKDQLGAKNTALEAKQ